MGLKLSAGGKLKIDLHTEGRIKLFYGWPEKKNIKPPYSGGSHIKLFLEIKLLHRLVGSQCSGADHLLGKGVQIPKHKQPYDGVPLLVPKRLLPPQYPAPDSFDYIYSHVKAVMQSWALLPCIIRETWGGMGGAQVIWGARGRPRELSQVLIQFL